MELSQYARTAARDDEGRTKTDSNGELRAVVDPGKRRYGVGWRPPPDGYRSLEPKSRGRELELPAGKTVVAEFKLRRPVAKRQGKDSNAEAIDKQEKQGVPKTDKSGPAESKQELSGNEGPKAPEAAFTNSIGMKFALIPAGEFVMGSPEGEEGRAPPWGSIEGVEEMQHTVRITRAFYISVYEVTQVEYEAVMGENPSRYSSQGIRSDYVKRLDTKRFPAENMTWFEAKEFCKRLCTKEGKTYRLPTEAEWEYACRAGTTTAFHFGGTFDGTQANIGGGTYPKGTEAKARGRGWPTKVGSYKPNAFGLYDMHGNVSEWCSDLSAYGYYAMSPRDDPPGAPITVFNPRSVNEETWPRAIRGGGLPGPHYARSASRSDWRPNHPRDAKGTWDIGIRLVCEVAQSNTPFIAPPNSG
jgi:formylglycine-generating enzyme required for sulfatase activity